MKTDIDDATGVTTQEADKAEQSTRNAVGWLVGAAALLYYRNQQQAAAPDEAISPEPIAVEVRPDIQDLGHPRPLPGGPDDLPPYDAHELPPAGGTTPPDETLHTAYRPENAPVVIRLSVGDEQIETDSDRIASDIQQLDHLDVVQRAITDQSLTSDPAVEIQVGGDRVFIKDQKNATCILTLTCKPRMTWSQIISGVRWSEMMGPWLMSMPRPCTQRSAELTAVCQMPAPKRLRSRQLQVIPRLLLMPISPPLKSVLTAQHRHLNVLLMQRHPLLIRWLKNS